MIINDYLQQMDTFHKHKNERKKPYVTQCVWLLFIKVKRWMLEVRSSLGKDNSDLREKHDRVFWVLVICCNCLASTCRNWLLNFWILQTGWQRVGSFKLAMLEVVTLWSYIFSMCFCFLLCFILRWRDWLLCI